MEPDTVKVGEKGKHLKIPVGWELVPKMRLCEKGDMWANLYTFKWCLAESDDIGMMSADFDYLVRKVDRGT
jgi:hypothetical protein